MAPDDETTDADLAALTDAEFRDRALRGLNAWYEPGWARLGGVVRGDDAQIAGGAGGVRYACCACRLLVELSYRAIKAELAARGLDDAAMYGDVATAKGWVPRGELVARERFLRRAAERGCVHFQKRLGYAAGTPAHEVLGQLALGALAARKAG